MVGINSKTAAQPTVNIAWGGDINIGRRFHYCFADEGDGVLARIAALQQADLRIVNLECVVSTTGQQGLDKGERASYYYRARPEMLKTLINANIDLVATANNHSGDYGAEALLEQAKWLDQAGIGYAGSGPSMADAFKPVIRIVNGIRIALYSIDATQSSFAAAPDKAGHAYLDLSEPDQWEMRLRPLISQARESADVILVAVHWGLNNKNHPCQKEIAAGHAIIDAGADAVLGTSAHMLQGIEIYRERPIIHDAGDLLFDAIRRIDNETAIFTLEADRNGVKEVRFSPLKIGFCNTSSPTPSDAIRATRRYARKCAVLGTKLQITARGEGLVALSPPAREASVENVDSSQARCRTATGNFEYSDSKWTVDAVPEDTRLPHPVRLGPLELLGIKVSPKNLDTRGTIFVESYWRLVETTSDDWRLDFIARGKGAEPRTWGLSSDHDACDWMWPTSRWSEGKIYRDYYGLRPPAITTWDADVLTLSVGLRSRERTVDRITLPIKIPFDLRAEEALVVLKQNAPVYQKVADEFFVSTPTILWDAKQIEQITGGIWLVAPPPFWYIGSVSHKSNMLLRPEMPRPRMYVATNTRIVARHELYSDLSGNLWDSHRRIGELGNRIDSAIVEREVPEGVQSMPILQVEDPLNALMQLGIAGRQRLRGSVVAVTGSAGKSTLCAMLAHTMAVDKTVRTNAHANYNSRVGLLHLLANTPEHTDVVVMEAAVSAINAPKFQNIKLVEPHIAVVTNIAASHLPKGKELAYIAQRKANIFKGVIAGGWAVIYRETAYFELLAEQAVDQGLRILTYGQSNDADIRLTDFDSEIGLVCVSLPGGQRVEYQLSAPGLHMALNSLACLAVRHILGFDVEAALKAMENFQPLPGRGEECSITWNGLSLDLTDESYNANPLSMKFALSSIRRRARQRQVLIFGDMLELGDEAVKHHVELAAQVSAFKPDCVLVCGDLMKSFWQAYQKTCACGAVGDWYKNVEALVPVLDRWLSDGDHVVVKSSNSMKLHKLVSELKSNRRVRP